MNYIVIPAYQPDNKLITLIEKIHEKSDFHILVIDDGSSSKCQKIFDKAKQYATVLRHEVNQGKGQALKTAFSYIQEQNIYGTVVTADADGQHKIWDIFRAANKASENPNKLILGVRAFTGKVPLRSRFGNSLTKVLFKLQTGVGVTDTQTGLRAFTTNLIPFMLKIEGQRYEYEMNMLLEASKEYEILEVPIETVYINDNEDSHFRPIKDGLMIYKNIFKFALSSLSSFVVDYIVYAIAILFLPTVPTGLRIFLANGLARVTSSVFNYSTNKKRFKKTVISYTLVTIFFFAFSRIYEAFSFGETSVHMHYLFAIPLVGGIILAILLKAFPYLSRISLNLWNSAVAIVTTGTLFRGIVNLSGRSTTLDAPYWYVGISFAILAILSTFINPLLTNKRTKVIEG